MWEVLPLPPDVTAMTVGERTIYFEHVKNGTVPAVYMSIEDIREMYGGVLPVVPFPPPE